MFYLDEFDMLDDDMISGDEGETDTDDGDDEE